MMTVAERAGFPACIVIRNGIEGTIAFPLMRPVKILCSVRDRGNVYQRHEFTFDTQEQLSIKVDLEEKIEQPSAQDNARLIREFAQHNKTSDQRFNWRVQATGQGIRLALDWIKNIKL